MNNPHMGADVLKYLDSIIPDTPEMQLIAELEAMRIQLTQVLIDARLSSNITQEQIAAAVNKDVDWVKYVEDCNHSMCMDDFVTYMRALNSDFEITVNLLNGSSIKLDSNQIRQFAL
ncbi:XRE family transcriptional regulator (plasmid) [Calothrix sp. NIES-4071]|nr:XRE family transcriptional regulator [Calothrix sp. NIES-4071]BAZ65079.1 XRE family transcriptional regulator [Calothrix sp. NIES-4105]